MLRWTSLPLSPEPHVSGKVVVVGHTPQHDGEILNLPFLKGIDTFCHGDGWLTVQFARPPTPSPEPPILIAAALGTILTGAAAAWLAGRVSRPLSALAIAADAVARQPNGALLVLPDVTTTSHRDVITSAAMRHKLPAIYSSSYFVKGGGLISYARSNGTFVHTLNTLQGFERKLGQLGLRARDVP